MERGSADGFTRKNLVQFIDVLMDIHKEIRIILTGSCVLMYVRVTIYSILLGERYGADCAGCMSGDLVHEAVQKSWIDRQMSFDFE